MLGTFYSRVGNVFVKPEEQGETCFGYAEHLQYAQTLTSWSCFDLWDQGGNSAFGFADNFLLDENSENSWKYLFFYIYLHAEAGLVVRATLLLNKTTPCLTNKTILI